MKSRKSDPDPKPASEKKLKQATLSFFTVTNKTKSPNPNSELNKKRKKSESDSDDIKILKVICNDQNNSISDTHQKSNVTLQEVENNVKIKDNDIKLLKACTDENKICNEDVLHDPKFTLDAVQDDDIDDGITEEKVDDKSESNSKNESMEVTDKDEVASSPLPLLDMSMQEDEDNNGAKNSDVSMNVSALLEGGDDKDSVISLSDIPITPMKTPTSANKKPRKLTPKQIARNEEMLKRKEEKEKEKEERERKKQEEKENKIRQREEKEEQKKREKLEKEMKRQSEINQKNEEKRKKEEEREQEKRRREEEKIQKDEEKRKSELEAAKKKEKAAAAFVSFFVLKKNNTKSFSPAKEEDVPAKSNFMPFEVKADMRLAPTPRISLPPERKQEMDQTILCSFAKDQELYLHQLKSGTVKPVLQGKTWPINNINADVMIIENLSAGEVVQVGENEPKHKIRAKLLQFHENRRPPYWGTWRKKSSLVRSRRPLGIDKIQFDYEVDSDDEWEEEEPGESIKGSEDEAEKESEDDYEVDNEFFVPHGYLSDEEAGEEEAVSPEAQKERLKMLEKEFNAEMKEKKQQLKPRILGTFYSNTLESKDPVYNQLLSLMKAYTLRRIPSVIPTSFNLPSVPDEQVEKCSMSSIKKAGARPRHVPDEAIPDLIRLIHGNTKSQNFLCKEFVTYWQAKKDSDYKKVLKEEELNANSPSNGKWSLVSIASVHKKIKELASWRVCPDEGSLQGRVCWYVPLAVRTTHGLTDLTLPNQWKYMLTFRKKIKKEEPKVESPEVASKPTTPKTTPSGSLITKFTKKLNDEERRKIMKRKNTTPITTDSPKVKPKLPVSPFSPLSAFCVSPSTSHNQANVSPSTSSSLQSPCSNITNKVAAKPLIPTSQKTEEKKGRRVSILVSVPRGQEIPAQLSQSKVCSKSGNADKNISPSSGESTEKMDSPINSIEKNDSHRVKDKVDLKCDSEDYSDNVLNSCVVQLIRID